MTHPNHIENKYETIPFGQFQGYASAPEKTTGETATVYIDDELDFVDCFFHFGDYPKSEQTDETEWMLKFDRFEKDGAKVTLTEWQQQIAQETIINSSQVNLRA